MVSRFPEAFKRKRTTHALAVVVIGHGLDPNAMSYEAEMCALIGVWNTNSAVEIALIHFQGLGKTEERRVSDRSGTEDGVVVVDDGDRRHDAALHQDTFFLLSARRIQLVTVDTLDADECPVERFVRHTHLHVFALVQNLDTVRGLERSGTTLNDDLARVRADDGVDTECKLSDVSDVHIGLGGE